MAHLLANMAASEWESTGLSTVWSFCMTVSLSSFLTTNTLFGTWFQTRWTVTQVALQWALMSTWQLFWAWSITGWCLLTTLNRWIKFGSSTWTWQWLSRIHTAGLTETKVAEVVALVLATAQSLVACLETDMESLWVSCSFLDFTAYLLALVAFACLELVADSCALELRSFSNFILCH